MKKSYVLTNEVKGDQESGREKKKKREEKRKRQWKKTIWSSASPHENMKNTPNYGASLTENTLVTGRKQLLP